MTGGANPHERYVDQATSGVFGEPLRADHRLLARGARRQYHRRRRHLRRLEQQAGRDRRPRGADPRQLRDHRERAQGCWREPQGCDPHSRVSCRHRPLGGGRQGAWRFLRRYPPGLEHAGGVTLHQAGLAGRDRGRRRGLRRLEEADMAPREPKDCRSMDEVRAEIDRIDQSLVDLIGERFAYVDRAWQLKQSPAEARVPWRIQQVIDKVRARAAAKDLPPELAEALWRQMIGWFVQYEEEKLRQSMDGKE